MKVAVHRVESIATEVDAMQRHIASRAEELHDTRGGGGQPLKDWIAAEREMIWRPAMEVQQSDGAYIVEAAVAGPRHIQDPRVANSADPRGGHRYRAAIAHEVPPTRPSRAPRT